jgi:hypothetical protein
MKKEPGMLYRKDEGADEQRPASQSIHPSMGFTKKGWKEV